jgi:hypothetical protein
MISSPILVEPKRARGRPRKTEDERDDGNRRQALISAAAQLFHRKGYDATSTREIAALAVKGKGEAISVFEVIWQASEDLTMAITMQTNMPSISMIIPRSLRLERGEFALILDPEHPGVVLGRDPHCAIVVSDRQASRQHARIERRRDKFFLIDQSTNGTFVTFDGEPEIVLLREEVMLRGRGRISFGHSLQENEGTVRFSMVR